MSLDNKAKHSNTLGSATQVSKREVSASSHDPSFFGLSCSVFDPKCPTLGTCCLAYPTKFPRWKEAMLSLSNWIFLANLQAPDKIQQITPHTHQFVFESSFDILLSCSHMNFHFFLLVLLSLKLLREHFFVPPRGGTIQHFLQNAPIPLLPTALSKKISSITLLLCISCSFLE